RDDFVRVMILAGEVVERLKARQRVENGDNLVKLGLAALGREPIENRSYSLASPFIPRTHRRFEIRIDGCQSPNAANDEPIGRPEATERGNERVERLVRIRLHEHGANPIHQPSRREIVKEGFEKSWFGPELIEDGHACHARLSGNVIDGKPGEIAR